MKRSALFNLAFFCTLTVGLATAGCHEPGTPATNSSTTQRALPPAQDSRSEGSSGSGSNTIVSYAPIVKRTSPAVVTVHSGRRVRAAQQYPFAEDPRFREYFGEGNGGAPQQPSSVQRGVGSGVIVSADGYVLTNHHVVDGAEEITVELTDRRSFKARVIGSDPPSDLALLKIEATELVTLPLGNSDEVEVGDVVLAVGNPLGLQQTVTAGIISAKNRATGLSDGSFEDFLQTDAPINQGNSGGALINTRGELIGINSQILSPTGGNIGIGFAIPSNMARGVMEQLRAHGSVRRGQLGVAVEPVTANIARELRLTAARGVVIVQVQPGSTAARAGLQRGDVIAEINGTPVAESNELRNRVAGLAPGTEISLRVIRGGQEQQLRLELGELALDGAGRQR